jgi:hypothetical protein
MAGMGDEEPKGRWRFSLRTLFGITAAAAVAVLAHRQVYFGTPLVSVLAWSVPAMLVILCNREIQQVLDRVPGFIAGKPFSEAPEEKDDRT